VIEVLVRQPKPGRLRRYREEKPGAFLGERRRTGRFEKLKAEAKRPVMSAK
jgi:hypothetical protein